MTARSAMMALLIVASAVTHAARAQLPYTEHTLRADSSVSRATATLSQVAWLAGHWLGDGLGAVVEETWLAASGGAMAGVFRLVRGDSVEFYELVTLVEERGSLVLRLKHFRSDLTGWEAQEQSVTFPLLRVERNHFWFDGLTMQQVSADEMHVWVALERAGNVGEALFRYRRVGPPRGRERSRKPDVGRKQKGVYR
jgi:hypothetical protein